MCILTFYNYVFYWYYSGLVYDEPKSQPPWVDVSLTMVKSRRYSLKIHRFTGFTAA